MALLDLPKKAFKGIGAAGSKVTGFGSKIGGKVAIFGGALAAIGVTAAVVSSFRGNRVRESKKELEAITPQNDLPPLMTSADFAMAPQGPADGYAAGQWSNYVQAGRGGAELDRGNPSNPRMSAVPESSVEDMGTVRR